MWVFSFVMKVQHGPVRSNAKVSRQGCNGATKLSSTFSSLLSLKEMLRSGGLFSKEEGCGGI